MSKVELQKQTLIIIQAIDTFIKNIGSKKLKSHEEAIINVDKLASIKEHLVNKVLKEIEFLPEETSNAYDSYQNLLDKYLALVNKRSEYYEQIQDKKDEEAYQLFKIAFVFEKDYLNNEIECDKRIYSITEGSFGADAKLKECRNKLSQHILNYNNIVNLVKRQQTEAAYLLLDSYLSSYRKLKKETEDRYNTLKNNFNLFKTARENLKLILLSADELCGKAKKFLDNMAEMKLDRPEIQEAYINLFNKCQILISKKYLDNKASNLDIAYQLATEECNNDLTDLNQTLNTLTIKLAEEEEKEKKLKPLVITYKPQQRLDIDENFEQIKINHKNYIDANMVSSIQRAAGAKINTLEYQNAQLYTKPMADYHQTVKKYLNHAIEQPTFFNNLGNGFFAALIGGLVGGASFFAAKTTSITDFFNPFAGVKNVAAGAFSTLLGTGVAVVAYKFMKGVDTEPSAKDLEEFQQEMEKAGFNDKAYEELSANLVKLFHFRECLLLGLKDDSGNNMREVFKHKLSTDLNVDISTITKDALKIAIEAYFLEQLNQLFTNGFQTIYNIHDKQIINTYGETAVYKFFAKLWNGEEQTKKDQERFTEQMQLAFMMQCAGYLDNREKDLGFFAKHSSFTVSASGFVAGAIVVGVTVALGASFTTGLFIALIPAALIAAVTYFAITKIDALRYTRNAENRASIKSTSELIINEHNQLFRKIKTVVKTTPEDKEQLAKYEKQNDQGFIEYFLKGDEKKYIALGTPTSWLREHASRYRHSKAIEGAEGLKPHTKTLIAKSDTQVEELRNSLVNIIQKKKDDEDKLQKFVEQTRTYLKTGDTVFISNFHLEEKIKQEILEIVRVIPYSLSPLLPNILVDFYKELGGSEQDLDQVRILSPLVIQAIGGGIEKLDYDAPYREILNAGYAFNKALNEKNNRDFILRGDSDYRYSLGLSIDHSSECVDFKLNLNNIDNYLNHSFDFLYSLLDYPSAELDKSYQFNTTFILYRTLLIKQLASLVDPSNQRVDPKIAPIIENFVKEKLGLDPKVVLNNVLAQSLFFKKEEDLSQNETIENPGNEVKCSKHNIEHVNQAILVDLAYVSTPITPKMLIEREAKNFLERNPGTLFFYGNSKHELIVDNAQKHHDKTKQVIERTRKFIRLMMGQNTLVMSRAVEIYIRGAMSEITQLTAQGEIFQEKMSSEELLNTQKKNDIEMLSKTRELFTQYKGELESILNDLTNQDTKKRELAILNNKLNLFIEQIPPDSNQQLMTNWPKKEALVQAARKLIEVLSQLKESKPINIDFFETDKDVYECQAFKKFFSKNLPEGFTNIKRLLEKWSPSININQPENLN